MRVRRNLLRYVVQVIPEQQVWFDLDKILIAAVLGFILGTGGNFLVYYVLNRDRRLRLLDREGKRHKFWKDFFEVQAALPEAARYSEKDIEAATLMCRNELSRSYEEVMDHVFWANFYSRGLAFGAIMAGFTLLTFMTHGDIFILLVGPPVPREWSIGQKIFASYVLTAFEFYFIYSTCYRPMRDNMKRKMLDRQRQGKRPIITLPELFDNAKQWFASLKEQT